MLLAAGSGTRLFPLTKNAPKCLTVFNGTAILERLITSLKRKGFNRLVVVTGYLEKQIRDFLGDQSGDLKIEYIFSPLYKETNNIYSLWMARNAINEPFVLFESDLVFDESLLDTMLYPDRMAVAVMKPWMNGTYVTVNKAQKVIAFLSDNIGYFGGTKYKTVNIYSFSLKSWHGIIKKLDEHILEGKVHGYYETVFAEMILTGSLSIKIISFDGKPWYEIDTVSDLSKAEIAFLPNKKLIAKVVVHNHSNILKTKLLKAAVPANKRLAVLNVKS